MNPALLAIAFGLIAYALFRDQINAALAQLAPVAQAATDQAAADLGLPSPVYNLANAPVTLGPAQAAALAIVQQVNAANFAGWFDPADVMAVIQIESSFNPTAQRPEPQIRDASYGLMQVLYATALDRGYTGAPEGLYDPAVNIALGMAQLKWIWDFLSARGASSEDQWIGAYNAGVGNALKGYLPIAYVQRWKIAREQWRQQLALVTGG